MTSCLPRARRERLIVQTLDDELLVYDTDRDRASVLNPTAAAVWKACDGKRSAADIAAGVSKKLDATVDVRIVWFTLRELSKKNLLHERAVLPAEHQRLTRRDFIRRAGLVGAAVALPVIVTVAAPKIADAASCSGAGTPCGGDGECCSKMCVMGFCLA